ncbi:MAG: UDP-N-acetylglucosamine 2-epimerase, partial [Mitsuaria chitosanitabida]|uniref:UDP-N-acetylglucosamine 2-epimerase n=1 Tax=Roseateles chitosanitabidus TaxID=65048 RepID=UPI001B247632
AAARAALEAAGAAAVPAGRFGVVTLHRPANVDEPRQLAALMDALGQLAARLPLLFPVHPRTRARLDAMGLRPAAGLFLLPPLPYQPFLSLWRRAALVLTDSGGLQEETTALGIPCLTVRDNTERPVTVDLGTNLLAGTDPARVLALASQRLDALEAAPAGGAPVRRPPLWDGQAASRIVARLAEDLLA